MARPKKIKKAKRICLFISEEQENRVKYMALRMSTQEGRQITVSEAIRMAIEAAYPIPKKQGDLFE